MKWHKVSISTEEIFNGKGHELQEEFTKMFITADAPKDMALYARLNIPDNKAEFYFSPGAVQWVGYLIVKNKGVPCEGPPQNNQKGSVAFLAGYDEFQDK